MPEGVEQSDHDFGLLSSEKAKVIQVTDLDAWFSSVYQYWYRSGFSNMVAAGLSHVFTLAFTISLSTFLFAFVDWHELRRCHDEHSCGALAQYIRSKTFLKERSQTARDGLALTYFLVFGIYWLWSCWAMVWSLRQAYCMRNFYFSELNFKSERHIQAVPWNEVVKRLGNLEAKGRAPWRAFQTAAGARGDTNSRISAHDIACRIMRKENYLIGMLNTKSLDLFQIYSRPGLTKTLEFSLHVCILDHVFGPTGQPRPNAENANALKRRFIYVGILHILLMPFVAAFMAMRFFLMHAQEWRDQKKYLGPRQWSPGARWSFRELNELPHRFESRLNKAKKYADAYLRLFPRPMTATLARCVTFVSGAILATLLAVAAIQGDSFLLYVTLNERNLVWYVGILSATFAAARALLEDRTPTPHLEDQHTSENVDIEFNDLDLAVFEKAMARVLKYTHSFPKEWRGKCHTMRVRDLFAHAFRYKAWLLFDELYSVLSAPIILCFLLPHSAHDIIAFVKNNTVKVDGLGAVLSHSLFYAYDNQQVAAESTPNYSCGQSSLDDKMIASFTHFRHAHPECTFIAAAAAFPDSENPARTLEHYDDSYRPPEFVPIRQSLSGLSSAQSQQIPPAMEIEFQNLATRPPDFLSGTSDHSPLDEPLSPI